MVKLAKRVKANIVSIEQRPYPLKEAVAMVKEKANAKFNETVECAVRTGLDTRHADQQIRTTFSFPHGTGKPKRVLVFVKGELIDQAREAGADYIGDDDLIEKIKEGWFEFDVAIATPDMMKDVGKLGKLLGTRGLMPNPKLGTVTTDLGNAVREFKAGKVELRAEKGGIIHCPVGKADFEAEKLEENVDALVRFILRSKPAGAKGEYLKTVSLSSTMGPGVRVDLGEFTS